MLKTAKLFVHLALALCLFTFVSCDSGNDKDSINGLTPKEIESLRNQYVIDGYVLAFGKSSEFVKSLETRKFLNYSVEEEILFYEGFLKNREVEVEYCFFMDKLSIVYSFLKDAPFNIVKKHMSEKYQFIKHDTENDHWIYKDEKHNYLVGITSKNGFVVLS